MKTNEERLRDALRKLTTAASTVYHEHKDGGASEDAIHNMRYWWKEAEDVLDATATSEMDRLVEWLQQDEGDYVGGEMQFSVIRVSRLLDHIREMKEQL